MWTAILSMLAKLLSIVDKRTPSTKESEIQRIRRENEKAHAEIDNRAVDARGIDTR